MRRFILRHVRQIARFVELLGKVPGPVSKLVHEQFPKYSLIVFRGKRCPPKPPLRLKWKFSIMLSLWSWVTGRPPADIIKRIPTISAACHRYSRMGYKVELVKQTSFAPCG